MPSAGFQPIRIHSSAYSRSLSFTIFQLEAHPVRLFITFERSKPPITLERLTCDAQTEETAGVARERAARPRSPCDAVRENSGAPSPDQGFRATRQPKIREYRSRSRTERHRV